VAAVTVHTFDACELCSTFTIDLMLLPIESDEKIDVLKHYFGITFDNELVVRGIEIRRHDVHAFIKRFQTRLLYTLFDCKDTSEVRAKGYENALILVTQAIDTIMTGKDLMIKILSSLNCSDRIHKNTEVYSLMYLQLFNRKSIF
jgi:DNA polymerase elongation subunit (family B)